MTTGHDKKKLRVLCAVMCGLTVTACSELDDGARWHAVPMVDHALLSAGYGGGEGCQWINCVATGGRDGKLVVMGNDVGRACLTRLFRMRYAGRMKRRRTDVENPQGISDFTTIRNGICIMSEKKM